MDPTKPIAGCKAETCENCGIRPKVHCHFTLKELGHFYLFGLPPFLIGGRGVLSLGWPWFALYLAVVVGFFGFLEIRVMKLDSQNRQK